MDVLCFIFLFFYRDYLIFLKHIFKCFSVPSLLPISSPSGTPVAYILGYLKLFYSSVLSLSSSLSLYLSRPLPLPGLAFFLSEFGFIYILLLFLQVHWSLHLQSLVCYFFQPYWDIINIYLSLRCTTWWFDTCIYCKMITTIRLVNTSIPSHNYHSFCGDNI